MVEQKLHKISCKHSDAVYRWNSSIARKTENNNTLIKCSPAFLNACQSKNSTLTSDRAFKQFVCEKLGIVFSEEFMYFASEKPEVKELATETAKAEAVADTTISIDASMVMRVREALAEHSEQVVREQLKKDLFSQAHIDAYIVSACKPETTLSFL